MYHLPGDFRVVCKGESLRVAWPAQVCARTITTTAQPPAGGSSTVVEAIPRINVNPKCAPPCV